MNTTSDRDREIKEKEALYLSLKEDILLATTELSSKLKEKKALLKYIEEAEEKLKEISEHAQKRIDAAEAAEAHSVVTFQESKAAVKRAASEIEVLVKQKKEAMKELKRINEWIFSSEDSLKELQKEEKKTKARVARARSLEKDIASLEIEKEKAIEEQRLVKAETTKLLQKVKSETKKLELAEKKAAEFTEKKKKEAQVATEELHRAVVEKKAIEKDLEVYIKRIKKDYKKAFPKLEMKI